jgi:hypothetical protein
VTVFSRVGFLKSGKMKKYWRIKVVDLEESLIYLNVYYNYRKILLNFDWAFSYLKLKYIYIVFDIDDVDTFCGGWCWNPETPEISLHANNYSINYLQEQGFKYCGDINLRKLKLEKLESI